MSGCKVRALEEGFIPPLSAPMIGLAERVSSLETTDPLPNVHALEGWQG